MINRRYWTARSARLARLGPGLLLALTLAPAWAAQPETKTFASERLTVRNLIGEVRVEGHSGSDFEVDVLVSGRDAGDGMIRMKATENQLDIVFPGDQTQYVYPRLGRRSSTSLKLGGNSWISDLIEGASGAERVEVSASGAGLELWADVTVRVPRGGRLEIKHGVGAVRAANVDGELELATSAGDISAERTSGELSVATGSGSVSLTRVDGKQIEVATGSGRITVEECDGQDLEFATGSGGVAMASVRARSVEVGTGSGNITAENVEAESVEIGAGSGDVTLSLDRMGQGQYEVGTGSGDIDLTVPTGASAAVHAETHSGKIHVNLDAQVDFTKQEKDEVRLTVGGGEARVELGSGSGDIRIRS